MVAPQLQCLYPQTTQTRQHLVWSKCLCCCLVTKLCPTLCDPMDCSSWGSSVHGILQTRILEWVAISFSITIAWAYPKRVWTSWRWPKTPHLTCAFKVKAQWPRAKSHQSPGTERDTFSRTIYRFCRTYCYPQFVNVYLAVMMNLFSMMMNLSL